MTDIREYLVHKPLLFDGGMGTYYKAAPGVECELANLTDPEGVKRVHAEYLAAGAQAIKTNTFGLPRMAAAQMPGSRRAISVSFTRYTRVPPPAHSYSGKTRLSRKKPRSNRRR